jgi:glycosyltransferase involved in cell wall biosynthesis
LSQPVVAVVVPAYNTGTYIGETLASLVGQSYTNWRALVVDDGSTDGTADVVREAAGRDHRIRLERQVNAGGSAARNKGIEMLAGTGARYLACVDSDDVLLPGAFSSLVGSLEARPDAVGAYGLAEYMDAEGHPISPGAHSALQLHRKTFRPPAPGGGDGGLAARAKAALVAFAGRDLSPDEDTGFDTLAIYGSIWPPAVAVTRFDAVREVGAFDPSIAYMEDWDLFLRLARQGPLVFVGHQVAWYRRHPRNSGSGDSSAGSPLGDWDTAFLAAVANVRYRAWQSPANTRAQRLALARAHRRDGVSLAKREAQALVADMARLAGWRRARAHLAWASYGVWLAAHPSPVPPDRRWLRALERARAPRKGRD